jgi:hypothetical protein
MKGCAGIIEAHWDNKGGFKETKCPICKTLFEPYLETRLRLMEVIENENSHI